ncbi:aspartyl/asparaginyl beta-hydroxylase isoform X7 [Ochotona princeps]|uniref:aspartyl/asparaginyl beta-hydroxylase isoform X7 n=1 Tax=Ochotona princeps TaxID=9978 RepID=UPI00271526E9|nr:aspartyl/asparaginyl beta-hydroxylase isoform X7 [Ochotona princeps]
MADDKDPKHGGHRNGRKGGLSGSSFFTWFMVIALLGVWTSVAVVWFELVDYEEVLGKLGVYDADGDGDFDVDDAKVLLEGPGGVAKRKTKAKELIKEELKKEKEKHESRRESKNEERRKGKKGKEDERKGEKMAALEVSRRHSPPVKQNREKEKAESSKTKGNRGKSAPMKDPSKPAPREKNDRKESRSSATHALLAKGNIQKRKN